jgi:hypothetical protein
MVLNRTHLPWLLFFVVGTLAIAALYAARFHPECLPFAMTVPAFLRDPGGIARNTVGGTRVGLLYGTLAFLIFIFAALLGARKKKPLWRVGRVETWLKAHIWLTLLTIPLVGFHCGWHWGSPHTTWALLLYIIVMASGIFGLAMQQFMPALMKERLPREVVFEQIPNIRKRILEGLAELKKDCTPPATAPGATKEKAPAGRVSLQGMAEVPAEDLQSAKAIMEFIEDDADSYLKARSGSGHRLEQQRESDSAFRILRLGVTPRWADRVDDLQAWCDERRRMDVQTRLQYWLHGWLLIHVPVSLLLIVVTLWHAVVAVRLFIVQP